MNLKNKKVLVTGADGFIGSHLVQALLNEGCSVKAFCYYNSFNSWGWMDTFPKEELNRIEVFTGDIRDPNGVKTAMKDIEIDDKAFVKIESIIQSMTPEERGNPELLNMLRKQRIAKGCGRDLNEVNMFIKQFDQMRKMMHTLSKGDNMQKMMSQFKGR